MSGRVPNVKLRREPDPRVGLADLAQERLDLRADLVGPHVDVGVVRDEMADPGQPRQRPRQLVSVELAVLRQPQRQVPVGAHPAPVDVGRLGAVHRLEAEGLVLGLDQEHVLAIEVPVAGLLPELLVDERRRVDLLVAATRLELAHGVLQRPVQGPALGMPERGARRDVVEAEQVELDAEPAMVAQLRLLAAPEVLIQLLLGRPDRAVDPLEHRALRVAAPVGAGDGEQLERADLARGRHVRPLAQVDERPVLVDRGRRHRRAVALGLRGEVVEDLDLERLIALGEEGSPVGGRQAHAGRRRDRHRRWLILASMAARSSGVSGRGRAKS